MQIIEASRMVDFYADEIPHIEIPTVEMFPFHFVRSAEIQIFSRRRIPFGFKL